VQRTANGGTCTALANIWEHGPICNHGSMAPSGERQPTVLQLVSEIVALVAATAALVVTLIERRP
jgi:hypothetical protein